MKTSVKLLARSQLSLVEESLCRGVCYLSLFQNKIILEIRSNMLSPNGVAYPEWFRSNIVAATGTIDDIALQFNCSRASVVRFRRLARNGEPLAGGRQPKLHPDDRKWILTADVVVHMLEFISMSPQVSLVELQSFLLCGFNITVSQSTVCRELKRCGYSRKKINRFSMNRDEVQRVNWWLNSVDNRGVAALNPDLLVDIDKSTFTWDSAQRKHGYSLIGTKALCGGLVSELLSLFKQLLK